MKECIFTKGRGEDPEEGRKRLLKDSPVYWVYQMTLIILGIAAVSIVVSAILVGIEKLLAD